jgi:hypothetical protein
MKRDILWGVDPVSRLERESPLLSPVQIAAERVLDEELGTAEGTREEFAHREATMIWMSGGDVAKMRRRDWTRDDFERAILDRLEEL